MDFSNEILNGLTQDMKEKVGACATAADLVAPAESEGVELNDDQLEMVSGGYNWDFSVLACAISGGYR
jgi:hypothetical protein